MQTIWKYTLTPTDQEVLMLPDGAVFLSVEEQRNEIVVYALVNPEREKFGRVVAVVGTGHPAPDWASKENFLGTVKMHGGTFMFHIFAQ